MSLLASAPETVPTGLAQPGGRAAIHDFPRPERALVNRYRALPTANVADAMDRMGVVDAAVRPMWPGARLAGPAFTVWTRAGDNQGIIDALEHVQHGDVIVVNGGGDESRALIGELIGGQARIKGAVGFVIDGAIRDAEGLQEYAVPVFARACTPAGPYKHGPYATSVAIAVGGVVVYPGDIVVGDSDGVVVIPAEAAERVAGLAESRQVDEQAKREAIKVSLPRYQPQPSSPTDSTQIRR